MYKIIATDNFGRDYKVEYAINIAPIKEQESAERVANELNRAYPANHPVFYKAVGMYYALAQGFEP